MEQHLVTHLAKEESHCLPLVKKHLDVKEIHELVGSIMGKRSSKIMGEILSLAVQNLPHEERYKMIFHMKEAMIGTYFEKWLDLGGWLDNFSIGQKKRSSSDCASDPSEEHDTKPKKKTKTDSTSDGNHPSLSSLDTITNGESDISPKDLEKLIRAIASNPTLNSTEKSATIQKLRDSVWKAKQRKKHAKLCDEESNQKISLAA